MKIQIMGLSACIAALIVTGCALEGSDSVVSIGMVRIVSCSYEGSFNGGIGYDCIIRNYGAEPREVNLECTHYDNQWRQIGDKQTVNMQRAVFAPNEERVGVRYYFHPKAKKSVCFDIRNFNIPTNELQILIPKAMNENLASELQL